MNICISTVYDACNCGAFLQAYALKKVLEEKGHTVSHIKYTSNRDRKHHIFNYNNISKINYLKRHLGFTYKNYRVYKKSIKMFNEITPNQTQEYDLLIMGSDELWNVTNGTVLEFINNSHYKCAHKIAFATSCGNSTASDIRKHKDLIEEIKTIERIFPRDRQTQKVVEEIIGHKCSLVCDPTILLEYSQYPTYKYKNINGKYMMYYGYCTEENQINYMRKYAKKNGLEIRSIGAKNYSIEKNMVCHPLNFVQYIKEADVVVTATFHGTIFSILCHKDVVCINMGSRKLEDLAIRLGIEDRLISPDADYSEFEKVANTKINFENVDKKILELRNNSLELLDSALSSIEKSEGFI